METPVFYNLTTQTQAQTFDHAATAGISADFADVYGYGTEETFHGAPALQASDSSPTFRIEDFGDLGLAADRDGDRSLVDEVNGIIEAGVSLDQATAEAQMAPPHPTGGYFHPQAAPASANPGLAPSAQQTETASARAQVPGQMAVLTIDDFMAEGQHVLSAVKANVEQEVEAYRVSIIDPTVAACKGDSKEEVLRKRARRNAGCAKVGRKREAATLEHLQVAVVRLAADNARLRAVAAAAGLQV